MPLIAVHNGCFSGGWNYEQLYTVFVPRFSAAALCVLFVSIIAPYKKLFYSSVASLIIILSFFGPYLLPMPIGLDQKLLNITFWNPIWPIPFSCSFIAKILSSLGSLLGLSISFAYIIYTKK